VINRKRPEGSYVTRWEEFELLPGVLNALALLGSAGVPVIVATNQRGIARGLMTEADLAAINDRLRAAVSAAGGRLDAIYHCPHAGGCRCRKPKPGMFEDAAAAFGVRLDEAVVIGDQPSDIEVARRIGALGVLVDAQSWDRGVVTDDVAYLAHDLFDAVQWLADRGHVDLGEGRSAPGAPSS
jgi:histidinol-phosphate phosphatase family protein